MSTVTTLIVEELLNADSCEEITVYNILHDNYDLDINDFFLSTHLFKTFKQHIFWDVRAHSFSQRIFNPWNELPIELVTSSTSRDN